MSISSIKCWQTDVPRRRKERLYIFTDDVIRPRFIPYQSPPSVPPSLHPSLCSRSSSHLPSHPSPMSLPVSSFLYDLSGPSAESFQMCAYLIVGISSEHQVTVEGLKEEGWMGAWLDTCMHAWRNEWRNRRMN